MSTAMFTQLPTVPNAQLTDIICAVQGNISSQETLSQVVALGLANTILHYAGNPNGHVAGVTYQALYDSTDNLLYICTTTGSSSTAVWTEVGASSGLVTPVNGGTGISSPPTHTIAVAQGAANFHFLSLTDGELLIGSSGNDPVPATLTAGTGVTIANLAGQIIVSASGTGFSWNLITGTSAQMFSGNGYTVNNAGLVTLTLPTTSNYGDTIAINGLGAGGWKIAQNAGQNIQLGSSTTTVGTGGSLASTNQWDSINLFCAVASTTWISQGGPQGNITVV